MFPSRPVERQDLIRIAERQAKTIFIHHYMDRHDFDLERLRKCCHHYPQTDGRVMPACSVDSPIRTGISRRYEGPGAGSRSGTVGG